MPSKGKKRTVDKEETSSQSSLSPIPAESPQIKRSKRAETRSCPLCKEDIPVRLLGAHTRLEYQRVEDIFQQLGSTHAIADEKAGRRSAVKARQSLNHRTDPEDATVAAAKVIGAIKRHRKTRHAHLRELTRGEEELNSERKMMEGACPVCLRIVPGDQDVLEAHVDSCLAHEHELARQTNLSEWDAVEGTSARLGVGVMEGVSFRGTGFDVRRQNEEDVDDDIDIDGEVEATFGEIQFTEMDVLDVTEAMGSDSEQNQDIDIGNTTAIGEDRSLRKLIAQGKVVKRVENAAEGASSFFVKAAVESVMGVSDTDKMDQALAAARMSNNTAAVISALEDKIVQLESMRVTTSTSLLCRICLDPYVEATTSIGCWHTCCRECWLRCLGSTRLCPICKRITGASELRRVYL